LNFSISNRDLDITLQSDLLLESDHVDDFLKKKLPLQLHETLRRNLIPPDSQPDPETLETIRERIVGGEMLGMIQNVVANLLQQFRNDHETGNLYTPNTSELAPSGAEFNQRTQPKAPAGHRPSLATSGDSDSIIPHTTSSVFAEGHGNSSESDITSAYSSNTDTQHHVTSNISPSGTVQFNNPSWLGISPDFVDFNNMQAALMQTPAANGLQSYNTSNYPPISSMGTLNTYSQSYAAGMPSAALPAQFIDPFNVSLSQIPQTSSISQQMHQHEPTFGDQFRRLSSPDVHVNLQQPQQFHANLPSRTTAVPTMQSMPTNRGPVISQQPLQSSLAMDLDPGANMPDSFFNISAFGQQGDHIAQANEQQGLTNLPNNVKPEDLDFSQYMSQNQNW
jgi:hypothetical protein